MRFPDVQWIWLSGIVLLAQATPTAPSGVIPRLTTETLDQAVACGRSGAECAVTPYLLCPDANGRYAARIATPFSRVASAVFDAQKSGRQGRPMTPVAVNRWGIGIYVFPAARSANADAIQRLELRREGRVITPLTATVGPIAAQIGDGSTTELARGFFTFPPETFSSSADVTVVFIGRSSGETTCLLERSQLQALR